MKTKQTHAFRVSVSRFDSQIGKKFSQKTNGRGSFEVDNKSVKCVVSSLTDETHSNLLTCLSFNEMTLERFNNLIRTSLIAH